MMQMLPELGDIADQPAHVVQAIRVCEEEMIGAQADRNREAQDRLEKQLKVNSEPWHGK